MQDLPDNEPQQYGQPTFEIPLELSIIDQSFFMKSDDFKKMKKEDQLLSNESIRKDKSDLVYALQTAYIGKYFLNKVQFKKALDRLESIEGPLSQTDFFNMVRKILYSLPDGHLTVTTLDGVLPENVYYRKKKVLRPPQKYWWKLELHEINHKKWHVLTLTEFPHSNDEKWHELYNALDSVTSSNGLILDLRNNHGGFTQSAHHLHQYLRAASKLYKPEKTHQLHRPLASVLRMNRINDDYRGKHTYLSSLRLKSETESLNYTLKYPNEMISSYVDELPKPQYKSNPFLQKVRLYLIVNEGCASSCESFSENLKYLEDVVTIGTNTAGLIHFGAPGLLFLRESSLKIYLPRVYIELHNKKFIEGFGFEPEFRVINTDSVDKTFETYLNSL